jgi:FkbM family methyltransferase
MLSALAARIAPRLLWRYRVRKWGVQSEERELALLPRLCHASKVSVDVGASLGTYTMHLLCYSKACIAFEVRPRQAEALRTLFDGSPVSVEAVGLSSRDGEAELRITVDDLGRSTLHTANALDAVGAIETIRVPIRTLDSYRLTNVGFMKIDVEGHELDVLRGAEETLRRSRPNLLIEVEDRHAKDAVRSVTEHLRSRGYAGFFLLDGTLVPIESFVVPTYQRVGAVPYINNFIFTPTTG